MVGIFILYSHSVFSMPLARSAMAFSRGSPLWGHTYAYPMFLQFPDIRIAAILAASVRVMDEQRSCPFIDCRKCHLQSSEWVDGLKRLANSPADYLMGIGICDKRQIAHTLVCLDICYIADPYFIGARRDNLFYEIVVFSVWMVRVSGFITFPSLYLNHKSVFAHQLDKGIPPGHTFRCLKQTLDYQI